jgi:hypothetical protein
MTKYPLTKFLFVIGYFVIRHLSYDLPPLPRV